uniref:DH domain-containing protein n=1 Tax=Macrostomum lignano TaxID=282301 RepID=A0A1I8HYU7_9PLAT
SGTLIITVLILGHQSQQTLAEQQLQVIKNRHIPEVAAQRPKLIKASFFFLNFSSFCRLLRDINFYRASFRHCFAIADIVPEKPKQEWLDRSHCTLKWKCEVLYNEKYYEAYIVQVIMEDCLEASSFSYARELIRKKKRLADVLEKVQPRVFTREDWRRARSRYQIRNEATGSASNTDDFFQSDPESDAEFVATTNSTISKGSALPPLPPAFAAARNAETPAAVAAAKEIEASKSFSGGSGSGGSGGSGSGRKGSGGSAAAEGQRRKRQRPKRKRRKRQRRKRQRREAAAAEAAAAKAAQAAAAKAAAAKAAVAKAEAAKAAAEASTIQKTLLSTAADAGTPAAGTDDRPVRLQFGPGPIKRLQEQLQSIAPMPLNSADGLVFLHVSQLRELVQRTMKLEESQQQIINILAGIQARLDQRAGQSASLLFEPLSSLEEYARFLADLPSERVLTLINHLRLCRRGDWATAVTDMVNVILTPRLQALVNFNGQGMRNRVCQSGAATELSDRELAFQSKFLGYIQDAVSAIYGTRAEDGRPSQDLVASQVRQYLRHGADRISGRSHRRNTIGAMTPSNSISARSAASTPQASGLSQATTSATRSGPRSGQLLLSSRGQQSAAVRM